MATKEKEVKKTSVEKADNKDKPIMVATDRRAIMEASKENK